VLYAILVFSSIDLLLFFSQYVEKFNFVNTLLVDIVTQWLSLPCSSKPVATLKDALVLFQERLDRKGVSDNYRVATRNTLKRFTRCFPENTLLLSITKDDLRKYLDKLTATQQLVNRSTLRLLFRLCVDEGYLEKNPIKGLEFQTYKPKLKGCLPVPHIKFLLSYIQEHHREALAGYILQTFFGIRSKELTRAFQGNRRPVIWSDIVFGEAIRIPAEASKTGNSRVIDYWPPCASLWLQGFFDGTGRPLAAPGSPIVSPLYSYWKTDINKAVIKAAQRQLGETIVMSQNILRHTYASYLVALFQSADKASLLMGHGNARLILQFYRDYVTEKQAQEFIHCSP
jgi:site-specific recombinase XerD